MIQVETGGRYHSHVAKWNLLMLYLELLYEGVDEPQCTTLFIQPDLEAELRMS